MLKGSLERRKDEENKKEEMEMFERFERVSGELVREREVRGQVEGEVEGMREQLVRMGEEMRRKGECI